VTNENVREVKRGFFVTGTDTGVGKTVAACAIVRALRESGIDVGVMKPVETGVEAGGPVDALALQRAAACKDALDEICPLQFELPAAPTVAARHAAEDGRGRVDLERIHEAYDALASRHEAMVVEGAGGLLVPVDETIDMGDLAAALALPLVVVARTALGTMNHTLLTLNEIERRGLAFAGVIFSHSGGVLSTADRLNFEALREQLAGRVLGEIPPLGDLDAAAPSCIEIERLLARIIHEAS